MTAQQWNSLKQIANNDTDAVRVTDKGAPALTAQGARNYIRHVLQTEGADAVWQAGPRTLLVNLDQPWGAPGTKYSSLVIPVDFLPAVRPPVANDAACEAFTGYREQEGANSSAALNLEQHTWRRDEPVAHLRLVHTPEGPARVDDSGPQFLPCLPAPMKEKEVDHFELQGDGNIRVSGSQPDGRFTILASERFRDVWVVVRNKETVVASGRANSETLYDLSRLKNPQSTRTLTVELYGVTSEDNALWIKKKGAELKSLNDSLEKLEIESVANWEKASKKLQHKLTTLTDDYSSWPELAQVIAALMRHLHKETAPAAGHDTALKTLATKPELAPACRHLTEAMNHLRAQDWPKAAASIETGREKFVDAFAQASEPVLQSASALRASLRECESCLNDSVDMRADVFRKLDQLRLYLLAPHAQRQLHRPIQRQLDFPINK